MKNAHSIFFIVVMAIVVFFILSVLISCSREVQVNTDLSGLIEQKKSCEDFQARVNSSNVLILPTEGRMAAFIDDCRKIGAWK